MNIDQELKEILHKHYKHPERLDLNEPYLVLFQELKQLIKRVAKKQ